MFLGQATSARQSRSASIAAAVLMTTGVRAIPVFLPSETSLWASVAMYVIPIGLTVLFSWLYLAGVQFRPPDRVVAVIEAIFSRASGLMGSRPAAASA
jgi:hypothetical protein